METGKQTQYYMIMNMLQPKALNQWFSQWSPGNPQGSLGSFPEVPSKNELFNFVKVFPHVPQ